MCINCGSTGCGGCQPQIPTSPAGAAGKNAFTLTTASFTMPAVSSNVTITVSSTGQYNNAWAKALQVVAITGAGYFQVVSTAGLNQITVTNLGYAGNATPADTIASGATVAPAGLTGAAGAPGTPGANTSSLLFSTEGINRTTAGWGTLLGFGPSLSANTLTTTGNRVIFDAGVSHYYQDTGFSTSTVYAGIRLLLNGSSVTLAVSPLAIENSLPAIKNQTSSARFIVSLRKAAATRGQIGVTFIDTYGNSVAYNPVDVTIDFTSAITVGLQGDIPVISGASYVSCDEFSATLYSL